MTPKGFLLLTKLCRELKKNKASTLKFTDHDIIEKIDLLMKEVSEPDLVSLHDEIKREIINQTTEQAEKNENASHSVKHEAKTTQTIYRGTIVDNKPPSENTEQSTQTTKKPRYYRGVLVEE